MAENKIILDTSALLELSLGSDKGLKIKKAIEEAEAVFLPTIILAEFESKLRRSNVRLKGAPAAIAAGCLLLPLDDAAVARDSGELHAEMRKTEPRISLIDCILMVHSQREKATVLTTDSHFRNFKDAIVF